MDLVNDTMRALAFLSRLPVPQRWFEGYDGSLSSTIRGFPLAGILIALPASLVLLIAHAVDLPEIVSALLIVVALIITTGALHEDGLADVVDGFYGGTSIDRRLEIMKDFGGGFLRCTCIDCLCVLADSVAYHDTRRGRCNRMR